MTGSSQTRSVRRLIATPRNTWGLMVQRDPDGQVFLAVVRAAGRGPRALPEGPLVCLNSAAQLALADVLLWDEDDA